MEYTKINGSTVSYSEGKGATMSQGPKTPTQDLNGKFIAYQDRINGINTMPEKGTQEAAEAEEEIPKNNPIGNKRADYIHCHMAKKMEEDSKQWGIIEERAIA